MVLQREGGAANVVWVERLLWDGLGVRRRRHRRLQRDAVLPAQHKNDP